MDSGWEEVRQEERRRLREGWREGGKVGGREGVGKRDELDKGRKKRIRRMTMKEASTVIVIMVTQCEKS